MTCLWVTAAHVLFDTLKVLLYVQFQILVSFDFHLQLLQHACCRRPGHLPVRRNVVNAGHCLAAAREIDA